MSGRCFQVGNPGISPREFTAHAHMGQRNVWYGGRAQIRIGLPSNLLDQIRDHLSAVRRTKSSHSCLDALVRVSDQLSMASTRHEATQHGISQWLWVGAGVALCGTFYVRNRLTLSKQCAACLERTLTLTFALRNPAMALMFRAHCISSGRCVLSPTCRDRSF